MNTDSKLKISLLGLRLGVTCVMLVWTIDKLLRPDHAATVFEKFYFLSQVPTTVMYVIGGLQLLLVLAFAVGVMKKFTYMAMLVLHGISTFSSFTKYLSPFEAMNLLYFAAWPMLAACLALFLLREEDTLFSLGRSRRVM